MPNRIIRDGWIESEAINALDVHSERFFLRLCLRADDFGRFHANPSLVKSSLYPLTDTVRSTDIPRFFAACEEAGLVRCYECDGKKFVEIVKFDQRTRSARSKFPAPDGHMTVIRQTDDRHPRTDAETKSESSASAGSETGAPAPAPAAPMPTLTLSELILSEPQANEMAKSLRTTAAGISEGLNVFNAIKANYPADPRTPEAFRGWMLTSKHGKDVRAKHQQLIPKDSNEPLPEPADWRECIRGHADLSVHADRAWISLHPHYQRLIARACEEANQ